MNIQVKLNKDFGRSASIAFDENISDCLTEREKERLESDLNALLKVFGGLTVAVIEDACSGSREPERTEFIEDLMANLERFTMRKL